MIINILNKIFISIIKSMAYIVFVPTLLLGIIILPPIYGFWRGLYQAWDLLREL